MKLLPVLINSFPGRSNSLLNFKPHIIPQRPVRFFSSVLTFLTVLGLLNSLQVPTNRNFFLGLGLFTSLPCFLISYPAFLTTLFSLPLSQQAIICIASLLNYSFLGLNNLLPAVIFLLTLPNSHPGLTHSFSSLWPP